MIGLDHINEVDGETLTATLLACCDVPDWADTVASERPYADPESLFAVADTAARGLSQILTELQERVTNDDATEAAVVAHELRTIALLRLRKVIES